MWTEAEIASRYVAAQQTSANDTIWGSRYADVAQGGAGDDLIQSFGGNDTLIGGLGNDRLEGAFGAETYVYNLGDGDDVIFDYGDNDSVIDTLVFGIGIAPADIVFSRVTTISPMYQLCRSGRLDHSRRPMVVGCRH